MGYNPASVVVVRGSVPPMLMPFCSLSPGSVFPLAFGDSASLRLPDVPGVAKLAIAGDESRCLHLFAGGAVEVHAPRGRNPGATSASGDPNPIGPTWALGARDFHSVNTLCWFSLVY